MNFNLNAKILNFGENWICLRKFKKPAIRRIHQIWSTLLTMSSQIRQVLSSCSLLIFVISQCGIQNISKNSRPRKCPSAKKQPWNNPKSQKMQKMQKQENFSKPPLGNGKQMGKRKNCKKWKSENAKNAFVFFCPEKLSVLDWGQIRR